PPASGPTAEQGPPRHTVLRSPLDAAVFAQPLGQTIVVPAPATTTTAAALPRAERPAQPYLPGPAQIAPIVRVAPPPLAAAPTLALPTGATLATAPASPEIALAPPAPHSVFGLSRPSAYVEGQFVAALRTPPGWVTVQPKPEGFPNSWERRVLLWFALSLTLVAPPAYLVARRLVKPLHQFADAAERLGREPMGDLPPLTGPAEIGRAAEAFNTMRLRLRRYVEDRTGMISAISHDLRGPLARMRFKMERVSPAMRSSLARDVDQMEAMISSVLAFMHDESSANMRETVDLRSLLECVVDEAGGKAELAPGDPILVHVDLLAIQRVFENLVDNAVKYGGCARVTLGDDGADVVVEIADEGPGLPPDEIDQVFKPFFRGSGARSSGAPGVGLGLAVSRSVLRSHGGDLTLANTDGGLAARARLPALDGVRQAA
ncbi:ATP-binding protein, partial [Novosphingobium sp.]|uniref:ATP-binding protein n=1 Tax=Novosphingobium sp. TaxID=1874826 RepID=UPI002B46470B